MVASLPGVPDEDDGLAGLHAFSEEGGEYRSRSVNLFADPKMRELKHYARSHNHEQRLRANALLECRPRGSQPSQPTAAEALAAEAMALRTDGCEVVNQHVKRVVKEAHLPTRTRHHGSVGENSRDEDVESVVSESREAVLRRMNRFHTRLQWRDHMDQSLNRLMADIELARDERLQEYAHKARCGHLDKIYDWYVTHGMKEARKERAAPPYVRYSIDGPVMPGSMRVAPKTREGAASTTGTLTAARRSAYGSDATGIRQSVSLPSLAVSRDVEARLGLPTGR